MLNNKILNKYRTVYQVNPKQKATFKFLSDTIPNPRSIFIIRGKRYVCEKLTATFTGQAGYSVHLLKCGRGDVKYLGV